MASVEASATVVAAAVGEAVWRLGTEEGFNAAVVDVHVHVCAYACMCVCVSQKYFHAKKKRVRRRECKRYTL